jgi:hypothetical protein
MRKRKIGALEESAMRTNLISRGLLVVVPMVIIVPAKAQIARPQALPFDRPVRTVKADLGPSEFYAPSDKIRNTLTCYYYPRFAVKELNRGEEGADWGGIIPIVAGDPPQCKQNQERGEIRFDQVHWLGYFSGVVGNYVFQDAPDGSNGSLAFRILDAATGKNLLEDEAKRNYRVKDGHLVWEGQRLHIERPARGGPVLTYTRGYFAKCSLYKDGAACWEKIRAATGLAKMPIPKCSGEYKDDPDDPSVIFYPVRVVLGPKPEAKPVSGPVRCEAQD